MAIAPISATQISPEAFGAIGPVQAPANTSFGDMLTTAVEQVNTKQVEAKNALSGLASGENVDIHGTMIKLEQAEISLRAMTSVRDRMVAAYEQIMNMAI